MSIINANPLLAASGGDYQISRSVRLRSSASAYFNRTPASSGTRTKATISLWVKRGAISSRTPLVVVRQGATDYFILEFQSDDTLQAISVTSSTTNTQLVTTQVFRDPSAWYHIVFTYDSTVATPNSSSIYLSVNGVKVTALSTATYPSQNTNLYYNIGSVEHDIGKLGNLTTYADCYLTEINSTDGQASAASSFGETDAITGVWKPKKYAGTYGTNGFYLNFSDNSNNTAATIGKDYSGNGNNWTPNNISVTSGVTYDSMLDVPTMWADGGNGRGNYCVINPVDASASATYANANLQSTSISGAITGKGTIGVSSGKWYWEVTCVSGDYAAVGARIGIDSTATPATNAASNRVGTTSTSYSYNSWNGQKMNNSTGAAYGATYTTNNVIGVALDLDSGKLWWSKDGTWQASGDPAAGTNAAYTGISGSFTPAIGTDTGAGIVLAANFGQRPFAYTPPTGFKALNTQNLPDATIKKGNAYFDATTFTGNASTQSIVNSGGMQPDLVWLKSRSNANNHTIYDVIRGVDNILYPNLTNAAVAGSGNLTAFNSNGFTLGASENSNDNSGESSVGWQWKESVTAGFDIVTGTAPASGNFNVSHNLGVTPAMIILKDRTTAGTAWAVWHKSLATASQSYLQLNSTNAVAANANIWGNTAPTSTQFTTQAGQAVIGSANYVAYLFAEVAGFSRFGSYTGNGSADGPFVYLGFRPKFVLVKASSAAENWLILDSATGTYNVISNTLLPNSSAAESTGNNRADFLSNGFKCKASGGVSPNASGVTYIYAAFAETAFKFSLGR